MPKSMLYQPGTPLQQPPECGPGRTEIFTTVMKNGRLYRLVVRDKIVVEDPYFVLVKAVAFAIRNGEPFMGRSPDRKLKDFLLKSAVSI